MNNVRFFPEKMDSLTVDAIETDSRKASGQKITFEDLSWIERELDLNEKVSLVFLLYDNPHVALQDLYLVQNGSEKLLLTEWASSIKNKNLQWDNMLLEALCLIQNFLILRRLGKSLV